MADTSTAETQELPGGASSNEGPVLEATRNNVVVGGGGRSGAVMNLDVSQTTAGFRDYMAVERRFSPLTQKAYMESVAWFIRCVGDFAVASIRPVHILAFKARLAERKVGPSRVGGLMQGLKCLLTYAQGILKIPVMNPAEIKVPRVRRRTVCYLTDEEVHRFLHSVQLQTWAGKARLVGYRFRALLETLLATGMRISECLALNRDSIDVKRARALIVGKGSKPRTVFFSPRSLEWLLRYLRLRADNDPLLFAHENGARLTTRSVQAMFRRHALASGIKKKVTPHILRHTLATHLLKNGCPVGAIKEILGHEQLETTCKFYLGTLDVDETQRLHQKFLSVSEPAPVSATDIFANWPPAAMNEPDRNADPPVSLT